MVAVNPGPLVLRASMWAFRHVSLLPLLLASFCAAEPVSGLHPTGYINDFAHVLNVGTISELNGTCREVDERSNAQIAVVTINTLDGRDPEEYARDLFTQWGIGPRATNRGVLIFLAVRDHKYRIEVGYGLESIISNEMAADFGREAVPLLRQGDFSAAIRLITLRVAGAIVHAADGHTTRDCYSTVHAIIKRSTNG